MLPEVALSENIKGCTLCAPHLPHGVRPVLQWSPHAKILIAGQAPGRKVHKSGIPFDDASGDRLRDWMGATKTDFYDSSKVAILPMGFCYPGAGKSGDLPPRPECAPAWRQLVLDQMPEIALTLVVGQYALGWHMPDAKKQTLTTTVKAAATYLERGIIPLPHPSPRNNIWMVKNPWFLRDIIPLLQDRIRLLLS